MGNASTINKVHTTRNLSSNTPFSRRRSSIRALYIHLDEATRLFPFSRVPRTCFAVDQTCIGYLDHPFKNRHFEKRLIKEERGANVELTRDARLDEECCVGARERSELVCNGRERKIASEKRRNRRDRLRDRRTKPAGIWAQARKRKRGD